MTLPTPTELGLCHLRSRQHQDVPTLLQDVFDLPGHLALVTQWANCGDLKSYITSYTQDNVRCSHATEHPKLLTSLDTSSPVGSPVSIQPA